MRNDSFFSKRVVHVVVGLLLLGYVLIAYKVIFLDGSSSPSSSSDETLALKMQLSALQKSAIQQAQEIKSTRQAFAEAQKLVEAHQGALESEKTKAASETAVAAYRPGVIVLGMHRSGTSALGGLINKMGLKTGGPLIQAGEDNKKGFFERIDVVLQDDYLMQRQKVHYSHNTYKYDALVGIRDVLNDDGSFFKEGNRGLAFLNNPDSYPWMLKDPRLCITLRTWLPLLKFIPAILFTYRHPMDVALSMNKREFERYAVNKGLRLWYIYNKRAVLQSQDLCRVITSHRKVMQQPKAEIDRIHSELHSCGVPVPHTLSDEEIGSFIDMKLQHGKSTLIDRSCEEDLTQIMPPSTWPTTDPQHIRLYREVMRFYCAMEDGRAFQQGFMWADFVKDD
jgi:hypothetical protein